MKFLFLIGFVLLSNTAFSKVLDSVPGRIDMSDFSNQAVGVNEKIVASDSNVAIFSVNQMNMIVENRSISIYSGANLDGESFAAMSLGYSGGDLCCSYPASAGENIRFYMDFAHSKGGARGTPRFLIKLNRGDVEFGRAELKWTSVENVGWGVSRYIFDSRVAGWSFPESVNGEKVDSFVVYIAVGGLEGFRFGGAPGEFVHIGDIRAINLEKLAPVAAKNTQAVVAENSETVEPPVVSEVDVSGKKSFGFLRYLNFTIFNGLSISAVFISIFVLIFGHFVIIFLSRKGLS